MITTPSSDYAIRQRIVQLPSDNPITAGLRDRLPGTIFPTDSVIALISPIAAVTGSSGHTAMNMASTAAITADYRSSPATNSAGISTVAASKCTTSGTAVGGVCDRHYRGYIPVAEVDDVTTDSARGVSTPADGALPENRDGCLPPLAHRGDRLTIAVDRLQASVKGFCDSYRVGVPTTPKLKRRGVNNEKKTPTFRVPTDRRKQVWIRTRVYRDT